MDAKLFRVTTQPNYYPSVSNWTAKQQSMGHYFPKRDGYLGPAADSRFPGWAGPMQDGRMGTDYRTHCYKNIPAGSQFASHQWIQHNTDSIIEITRNRLSRETGANSGFECGVVPPPERMVKCNAEECEFRNTDATWGIGMERKEPVPELFGTFNDDIRCVKQPTPPVTQLNEGGRNSVRGLYWQPLGNGLVGPRNHAGTYLRE